MKLLKLVVGQIKVGAPLPFNVRDEKGHLLLAQGHVIDTEAQLETLVERGIYVDREEILALKARADSAAEAARPKTLFDLWEQAIWQLERLFKEAAEVQPGFVARFDAFAAEVAQLVQRDPDVAIYLSMRHDERRHNLYGLTHSLHTAVAGHLLATRLGWAADHAQALLKAALTMNLSVYELQGRHAATGRLSESQRAQMKMHPRQSMTMLQAAGVTDPGWLATVLEHHERLDGSGYPDGLTQVSQPAQALRLADVFMAKISPRTERPALPIQSAARQMFSEAGGSPMAAALIKEYGIYPPGDFVQLACGEMAVVIRRGATATTPVVAAITNRTGMPVVTSTRRDTSCAGFAITGPASDRKLVLRVPPERLFGLVS